MPDRKKFYSRLSLATFFLAIAMFLLSLVGNNSAGDTERTARYVRMKVEGRIEVLEQYMEHALSPESDKHICLDEVPDDMVIYKYVNDSLKSWSNQFSVLNDDISNRMVFQRLTNLRNRIVSPLTEVTGEYSYMNLGPKWYIVKSVENPSGEKVIAGIEIMNTLIDDINRNDNGVNPYLNVSDRYSVTPLNFSGGSAVYIHGKPLFKIREDNSAAAPFLDNSIMKWIGLLLFTMSTMLFLAGHRTLRAYISVTAILTFLTILSFMWGIRMNGHADIFSPTTYADGQVLFSLGALLLINTYISLIGFCTYLAKDAIEGKIARADS